jgi:hypothetical protein
MGLHAVSLSWDVNRPDSQKMYFSANCNWRI